MRNPNLPTRTMKISDVKNALSSVVNEVYRKETRVLVEKSGIPAAAIISVDDYLWLCQLEREWEERFKVIDRIREAFKDVPAEAIEREAERSVAGARERLRHRTSEAVTRSA